MATNRPSLTDRVEVLEQAAEDRAGGYPTCVTLARALMTLRRGGRSARRTRRSR